MNNICKKLCMCMISGMLAMSAGLADDTASTVAQRTDCVAVNAEISKLSALSNPTDEDAARLAQLQIMYRRDCVVRSVKRRGSGRADEVAAPVADTLPIETPDAPDDVVAEPVEEPAPKSLSAEEIAANINAGLCADGTRPNRFGCCTGEKFKDLGNLVFACCRDDGECFPPIE